jgi:hypothetical protein
MDVEDEALDDEVEQHRGAGAARRLVRIPVGRTAEEGLDNFAMDDVEELVPPGG